MATRFDMAEALVSRAKQLESDFDDGTPYDEALVSGSVSLALQIQIKEVFDHLRSALDYCTREIYEKCLAGPPANIYFPIAARGANPSDFPSLANNKVRGLLRARPDLVTLLASFQEFASPDNAWLPDFATLSNENKHEQLTVTTCPDVTMTIYENQGVRFQRLEKADKSPIHSSFGIIRSPMPVGGVGVFVASYVCFTAIDQDVKVFLQTAVKGVQKIITELKDKI